MKVFKIIVLIKVYSFISCVNWSAMVVLFNDSTACQFLVFHIYFKMFHGNFRFGVFHLRYFHLKKIYLFVLYSLPSSATYKCILRGQIIKKQIDCLLIVTRYKFKRNIMCKATDLCAVEQNNNLGEIKHLFD